MGYGCYGYGYGGRRFLTREERMGRLREYRDELASELKGVEERLKELESAQEA